MLGRSFAMKDRVLLNTVPVADPSSRPLRLNRRPRRAGRSAARVRAVAVSLLLFAACSRSADTNPPSVGGITITPAIPKPAFTLRDTDGRPFNFRTQTHGKLTFLFFGYTHCPDVCPLQMANLASALHELPPRLAHNVMVVFVTTDSERDTPQRLRQWLDRFDSSFVGLTGTLARVNAAQAQLRVLVPVEHEASGAGTYSVGHSAVVLAFSPDDSAHVVYPIGVRQSAWTADLQRLADFAPPDAPP
jgi:protein SCO1